jgi:hypothetical protein
VALDNDYVDFVIAVREEDRDTALPLADRLRAAWAPAKSFAATDQRWDHRADVLANARARAGRSRGRPVPLRGCRAR